MVSEAKEHDSCISEIDSIRRIGKMAVDLGLVVGSGGNISILLPEEQAFVITGTGTQLDNLDQDSFAKVALDGEILSNGVKPSSEFRVHLAAYQSRPDISVCIHLHPQKSVLLAALGLEVKFLTIDHVYYLRKVSSIPWIQSGTKEIADAVFREFKSSNVIILENHGCVVVGSGPEIAFSRALNLEEAADLTLQSRLVGIEPNPVPPAYWAYLEEKGL